MLFTHFGMSGPLVLSASAHIRDMKKYGYRVCIDLKPALPPEKLYKRVSEDFALLANREAANCLVKLLPASMQPVMLDVWGMDPQRKVNQITREERRRLVELLKAFPVELAGKGDLAHAVVTSGGVSVKEVDPKQCRASCVRGCISRARCWMWTRTRAATTWESRSPQHMRRQAICNRPDGCQS